MRLLGIIIFTGVMIISFFSPSPCALAASGGLSQVYGQGVPNKGYLDSFHPTLKQWSLSSSGASRELSLTSSALRLIKTEELLMTRKGYLELLHPDDSYAPYLPYPAEVRNIFTNGVNEVFQIKNLMRHLERGTSHSKTERMRDRRKIFKELTSVAITLTEMDRLLRFLSEEIFKDNPSLERMVHESLSSHGPIYPHWGMGLPPPVFKERVNRKRKEIEDRLREKLNIPELIENLLAQRTFTLNRYPLLGVSIEGGVLYQVLYKALRIELNLPNLNAKIDSRYVDLSVAEEIELGEIYQSQLDVNFEILSHHPDRFLALVAPFFDRGIKRSLEGNFEFLKELCKEVYFWDNPDPYLVLALDQSNWSKLLEGERFFWMDKEVFEQGKKEMMTLLEEESEREERNVKIMESAGWWVSVAGLSSFLVSSGVGSFLSYAGRVVASKLVVNMGRGVFFRTMTLGGGSYLSKSLYTTINRKRYKELVENLYLGSVDQGIHSLHQDYQLVLKQNYREIVYGVGMLILFGRGLLFNNLSALFKPVIRVGQGAIGVSGSGIKFLRTHLQAAKKSILNTLPFFHRLISRTETLLSPSGGLKRLKMGLSELVRLNAFKAGISARIIRQRVMANPLIQRGLNKLTESYVAFSESIFVRRQMIVEFLAAVSSEILVRGDKIFEELDYVMLNIVFSVGSMFALSAQTYTHALRETVGAKRRVNIFPRPGEAFSSKKFFSNWGENAVKLLPSLMWMGGIVNGAHLLLESENGSIAEEDVYKSLENLFWMVSLYAAFSPIRSQFVGQKIDPAVDRLYTKSFPGVGKRVLKTWSEDIKVPISIANNMVGTVARSFILSKRGRYDSSYDYGKEEIMYLYREPNKQNTKYLFPEIIN